MIATSIITGAIVGLATLSAGHLLLELPLPILAMIYPVAGGLSCQVMEIYLDCREKRAAMTSQSF